LDLTILGTVLARLLKNLRDEERGQDMVEYVLLLSFIVLVAMGVVTGLGVQINTIWSSLSSAVNTAAS
jgi:Flp pilus assembly pilin Flp